VQLDQPFDFEAWMRGLDAGRSFVTTGPMILARANGKWPGAIIQAESSKKHRLECTVLSEQPLESIELIVNGQVARRFAPENKKTTAGAFENTVSASPTIEATSWMAWRCFEQRSEARFRFAHTAPWYFEVPGQPLRPRRVEVQWLMGRVKEEIARSSGIAPAGLIDDYQRALAIYEALEKSAE
jgi:hypothetical protein